MQDGEFLRTSCGSPNYAAPEVISGKLYAGPEVDVWSCGVILYALLCGTLPFDDEHIPNLFKKIKSGLFHMPDYLSQNVRDLLKKMLTVDPVKRVTVEEIRKHAWFIIDLPNYLFPQERDEDASIIDKEAVYEVCRACNVTEREVFAALIAHDPSDQLVIAYSLITDNKRFGSSELNPEEVNNFYVATGPDVNSPTTLNVGVNQPGISGKTPISPLRSHPERMPEGQPISRTLDPVSDANLGTSGISGNKRFKWHLGIRSQSKPWDIMYEVFKAMKTLNYEWKVINPFTVRVRKYNNTLKVYSKMMLQLYQVDTRSYLLDFKCIDENPHPEADPMSCRRRSSGIHGIEQTSTSPFAQAEMSGSNPSSTPTRHLTMEFFEMCTELITALAR